MHGGLGWGFGEEVPADACEAEVFPHLGEGEVCGCGFDGGDEGDVVAFVETAEVFAEGQVAEQVERYRYGVSCPIRCCEFWVDLLVKLYHATRSTGPEEHLLESCSMSLLTWNWRIGSCSFSAFSEKAWDRSRRCRACVSSLAPRISGASNLSSRIAFVQSLPHPNFASIFTHPVHR